MEISSYPCEGSSARQMPLQEKLRGAMPSGYPEKLLLFGGELTWFKDAWVAQDDRVRGGQSQSYLEPVESNTVALFHGNLDIDTLGGAGFASQRTATNSIVWDLSGYDAIHLTLIPEKSDNKNYTLVLKDTLLPPDPNTGRDQSTISYESAFSIPHPKEGNSSHVDLFIKDFEPYYRGKKRDDAPPLKQNAIRRISIMMRSTFGEQAGPFHLALSAISATNSTLLAHKFTGSSQDVDSGNPINFLDIRIFAIAFTAACVLFYYRRRLY